MPCRTRAVLGVAWGAALLSLAACTTDRSDAEQSAQPRGATAPGRTPAGAAPSATPPPLRKPPELDADSSVAGRRQVTTGNAEVPYSRGKKGDALTVAVSCQGKGKITVAVESVHVSFPLECGAHGSSSVVNQFALSEAERSGVVSVEASPAVRWSMTIGHGAPAQAEPPDAG